MTHSPMIELASAVRRLQAPETPAARSASGRGRSVSTPSVSPRPICHATGRAPIVAISPRVGTATWPGSRATRSARAQRPLAGGALGDRRRVNYGPDEDPLAGLARRGRATISVYARHRDYHDLIRASQAAGRLDARPLRRRGQGVRRHGADTGEAACPAGRDRLAGQALQPGVAPLRLLAVPRRDLHRSRASADPPEVDHCGSCRACLDVCPTDAFPAPYQLDARRCISYLTIEHQGHIPREFRAPMGNRIYGCDDCLAVCPWNKFARTASETAAGARRSARAGARGARPAGRRPLPRRFAGSPIKRTGRDRFVRNVLIAIGNSAEPGLARLVEARLADPSPLVRAMAVWALRQLQGRDAMAAYARHREAERDSAVLEEWREALARCRACSASAWATPRALARRLMAEGWSIAAPPAPPTGRHASLPKASRSICSAGTGRSGRRRRSPARPIS